MYFSDLTNYLYFHYENSKNIGWLDITYPYTKGTVSEEFLKSLWLYLPKYINMARGFHVCNLCTAPNQNIPRANYDGESIKLGYAEIRVLSEDGNVVYAAPNLIYHYILDHEYKPPKEFIEAVIRGPKPGSSQYESFLSTFKEDYLDEHNTRGMKITTWGENTEFIGIAKQFYSAIVEGNLHYVIRLLDTYKENLTILINLNKWLQIAASIGQFEIVEYLIKNGANMDVSIPRNNPLFGAIIGGYKDIVKLLIDEGIDFRIKYDNLGTKNMDAKTLAQEKGQDEILQLLLYYENKEQSVSDIL